MVGKSLDDTCLFRASPYAALLLAILLAPGCAGPDSAPVPLTAETPLHLEDHLEAALMEGTQVPEHAPEAVEWRFKEGVGEWKAVIAETGSSGAVAMEPIEDGVRLRLTEATAFTNPQGRRQYRGVVYVDLPGWNRQDWAHIEIRARTDGPVDGITVFFNLREPGDAGPGSNAFQDTGVRGDVIEDGSPHTYIMRPDWSYGSFEGRRDDSWRQLGVGFGSEKPASLDLLSVKVIPKAANYADQRAGVASEVRGKDHRRVLYTHAPGRIDYRIRVPDGGRLDVGLGVLRDDVPVTFRVRGGPEGEAEVLLQETITDTEAWHQRSVDLARWSGRTISLALETEANELGTVALWAAPTVSGVRATERPNVILYIIDAGGADYMSVYGYNRPTTPNLERLAREGAIFERAYSNSTWSKTSTPSFVTSLHHSVLGGYETDSDPIPVQARTMAEHLHAAAHQTAIITSNPYAGTMSSLDRGADFLRDNGAQPNSTSTVELHGDFWRWRQDYPGEPYFVHFQTTDVHWPWHPPAPFAGLFVEPERRQRFYEWEKAVAEAAGLPGPQWLSYRAYPEVAYETAGVDRIAFFEAGRGLYDETMAHQDWQLGRLVERLKAEGEWEHTLLIVAADHGNAHGLGVFDPLPGWMPTLASHLTRIPLIIVWPGRIPGGQRFAQPVSMIDILPTILDLIGLPMPEVMQGQSLAPLLLGTRGWEPRPVVFDEFYVDSDTGELEGTIAIIDGRWGATLRIESEEREEGGEEAGAQPPRLRLYDLWNDPYTLTSVHEEHADLAELYQERLRELWAAHKALAQRFSRTGGVVPLTSEQLRTLRSLGYIQ